MSEYADRDIIAQGGYYLRHVSAMTAERLHEKSDIAAELAHRDQEIDRLRAERDEARADALALANERNNWQAMYNDAEAERNAARALLLKARVALEYHQQQTRPIHATAVAIAAIDDLLGDTE